MVSHSMKSFLACRRANILSYTIYAWSVLTNGCVKHFHKTLKVSCDDCDVYYERDERVSW